MDLDANTALQGIVLTLPPGANPFTTISSLFSIYPLAPSSSFQHQLVGISAVLGCSTLAILLSLAARIHLKQFWLFKVHQCPARGRYVTTHYINAWLISTGVFLGALQLYIFSQRDHDNGSDWGRLGMFLEVGVWWPSWFARWMAIWAITVSLATRGFSTTDPASPSSIFTPRFINHPLRRALTSPAFINTHFILIPVVSLICILVPSIIATAKYERLGEKMDVFHAALDELNVSVDVSTASKSNILSSLRDDRILRLAQACLDGVRSFAKTLQLVWILWLVISAYTFALVTVIAIFHHRFLKAELLSVQPSTTLDERMCQKRRELGRTRSIFFSSTASIALIEGSYTGLVAFLAIKNDKVVTDSHSFRVSVLAGVYIFTLFGSILALLLGAQTVFTIRRVRSERRSTRPPSDPAAPLEDAHRSSSDVTLRSMDRHLAAFVSGWLEGGKEEQGELGGEAEVGFQWLATSRVRREEL